MLTKQGLAAMSAVEMAAGFADRTLSPVEVHDAVQSVIEARESVLNAFWVRDPDESRKAALASEARWAAGEPLGPLDGVPVTLKENVARRGVPMPSGNAGTEPVVPETDAPITARVLESGGVILGSTVMPDWGMLSSGVSSRHGISRSPWNPDWTTGGSSSGAGTAAAGGYGPLHVGTDIGGSIRLPGTWLGLATLKPSYGRIPLDTPYLGRAAGPMTRTVADAALFMGVLSQPDSRDWTSLPPEDIDWSALDGEVRGLRVGVHLDAELRGAVRRRDPRRGEPRRRGLRGGGSRRGAGGAVYDPRAPGRPGSVLAGAVLERLPRPGARGRTARPPSHRPVVSGGADVPGARVLQCYQQIMRIQARTVAATLPYDLMLSPVAPVAAFAAEQPMPFPGDEKTMAHIGFTAPYNMSGQPAATVNCGFTADRAHRGADRGPPIRRSRRPEGGGVVRTEPARRGGPALAGRGRWGAHGGADDIDHARRGKP
ncbi:amidase family protein [Streptomyces indonesiensis]